MWQRELFSEKIVIHFNKENILNRKSHFQTWPGRQSCPCPVSYLIGISFIFPSKVKKVKLCCNYITSEDRGWSCTACDTPEVRLQHFGFWTIEHFCHLLLSIKIFPFWKSIQKCILAVYIKYFIVQIFLMASKAFWKVILVCPREYWSILYHMFSLHRRYGKLLL